MSTPPRAPAPPAAKPWDRPLRRAALPLLLVGAIAALTALGLARGGLVISQHEGDLLHLTQVLMLMQQDWVPHLDFRTPVGLLAFWPLDLALDAGWGADWGIGQGFVLAQGAVALALVPAIWWVAVSRFVGWAQAALAGVAVIWLLALVHGGVTAGLSVSMHYNRWAWTVAMLAILTACLPRRAGTAEASRVGGLADALLIGVGFAILGLTKASFAVAFAPGVILALLLRGQTRVLAGAVLAGLAACAAIALVWGAGFWPAYVRDLLWVAGSSVRPYPGQPLSTVIAGPAFLPATLLLLAAVIALRRDAPAWRALPLLLLAPGFVYVTYQNFGNDPKWLLILAFLLAHRWQQAAPGAARTAALVLTVVAGAMASGSLVNMARSTLANALGGAGQGVALFAPDHPGRDLRTDPRRLATLDLVLAAEEAPDGLAPPPPSAALAKGVTIRPNTVSFMGAALPNCGIDKGLIAHQRGLARAASRMIAKAKGPPGPNRARVFVADLFSAPWIFGDLAPVTPLAPWNYGALTGIASADYLLVPLCAVNPPLRKTLLTALTARAKAGRMRFTRISPARDQDGLRLYAIRHE